MMHIVFDFFFNVCIPRYFYAFCLVRYSSAVCLNLLALDSCFVSVDGGSVTLAQPCHRTARCQSLK